ncbi:alkaline-phosphatase-like protein [Ilyonectria destructans]|nr:alkaline-phosphatase-like protein [Ilyonectria destructans]
MGRVLDKLEQTRELNNTFVIFMSDNGAEGSLLEAIPLMTSTGVLDVIKEHPLPCIVRYPPLSRSHSGSVSHEFVTVMNLPPTCLELAGVPHPGKSFRGRDVVQVRGKSWVPFLSVNADAVHDMQSHVTGWELFGLQAIRRGDYKAVWMRSPRSSDPGELQDLSEKEERVTDELLQHRDTSLKLQSSRATPTIQRQ